MALKPRTPDDRILEALQASGWRRTIAAHQLGLTVRALNMRMKTLREQGHHIGDSPYSGIPFSETQICAPPQGFVAHGVSTLHGPDGQVKAQWVKSSRDRDDPAALAKLVREAFADATPVKPVPAPKRAESSLLTVYPIGDHHVAMYAWGAEVAADYDIKTSERLLVSAATHLVHASPPSETGLIVNLGDFFHVDNLRNETSRSGHTLDVDTRYTAMIRAGVTMMRAVIEIALTKHRRVKVINAIGNHDDVGAQWFSLALALAYEANPRVEVEQKPGKFHYHRHGTTLLGVTHGDTGKPEKLQSVMAADVPDLWGKTRHRYWLTGHVHTKRVVEFPGVVWETFRTLAPGDAWSHAAGYRSGRDMTSIIFDARHGEIGRNRFDVGMLAE